jgi:hypothetical protein
MPILVLLYSMFLYVHTCFCANVRKQSALAHTHKQTHTHTQFATPWRNMPCPVLNLPGIGLKEFQVEKH